MKSDRCHTSGVIIIITEPGVVPTKLPLSGRITFQLKKAGSICQHTDADGRERGIIVRTASPDPRSGVQRAAVA